MVERLTVPNAVLEKNVILIAIWSTLLNVLSLPLYTFLNRFSKIGTCPFSFQLTISLHLLVFLLPPSPTGKKCYHFSDLTRRDFWASLAFFYLFNFFVDLAEGLIAV